MAIIGSLVIIALWLMGLVMMLRFVLVFIDPTGQMAITAVAFRLTEPIYAPIRRMIPQTGTFDLSPLVAILLLIILQTIFRTVWP